MNKNHKEGMLHIAAKDVEKSIELLDGHMHWINNAGCRFYRQAMKGDGDNAEAYVFNFREQLLGLEKVLKARIDDLTWWLEENSKLKQTEDKTID